jgi:O-antigen/teichoic acid export membrane protein
VWLTPWAQLFLSYFLLAVLTSFAGQVALGRGESAVLGKIALAGAAVNLVVGLALVGRFGVGGVVLGTVAAYLVGVPAQAILLFPKLGVDGKRFLRESVLPVYGPLVPSGIVLWLLLRALPPVGGAVDLLVRAAFSCALLWIPLWWTAVEPRDRMRIRSRLAHSGSFPR